MCVFSKDHSISVGHSPKPKEAITRLKQKLEQSLTKAFPVEINNFSQSLSGNSGTFSCTVKGFSITGTMSVTNRTLDIMVSIPRAACVLVNTSELKGTLSSEIGELLNDLTSGSNFQGWLSVTLFYYVKRWGVD